MGEPEKHGRGGGKETVSGKRQAHLILCFKSSPGGGAFQVTKGIFSLVLIFLKSNRNHILFLFDYQAF